MRRRRATTNYCFNYLIWWFLSIGKWLKIVNLETNSLFATSNVFYVSWIWQNMIFFRNWRRQKSRMERRHFRLLHFVSVAMPFIGWRRGGRAKLFLFSASSFREMRSLNNMGCRTQILSRIELSVRCHGSDTNSFCFHKEVLRKKL